MLATPDNNQIVKILRRGKRRHRGQSYSVQTFALFAWGGINLEWAELHGDIKGTDR